jgi:hypothetical protein
VSLRSGAERKQRKTVRSREIMSSPDGATHASRASLTWHNLLGARTWPVQDARLVHLENGGGNSNRRVLFLASAFGGAGAMRVLRFSAEVCVRSSIADSSSSPAEVPVFCFQLYSSTHTFTLPRLSRQSYAPCNIVKRAFFSG